MDNKILITGAAGFIGSNLVDSLLSSGRRVVGIDNFDPFYERRIKENNIKNALENEMFEFEEGDIRDAYFLDKFFRKHNPWVVVHLAAKAGVRPSLANPVDYYDVNVMGTLSLLEIMRKYSVRKMIFASSSSVYGNNTKVPFSETDFVDNPISPYAASKKACELLCHTYHHIYDFDIYCLRFFTVYGARQRPDLAIHKFTRALFTNEPIIMFGDGSTSRDYTHIKDTIQGIINSIDKINDIKGYHIFNLGESKTVSLIDLVRLLEKYTGRKTDIISKPLQDGDVKQTFADISKAKNILGYCPVVPIEKGLKDFIKWYAEINDIKLVI